MSNHTPSPSSLPNYPNSHSPRYQTDQLSLRLWRPPQITSWTSCDWLRQSHVPSSPSKTYSLWNQPIQTHCLTHHWHPSYRTSYPPIQSVHRHAASPSESMTHNPSLTILEAHQSLTKLKYSSFSQLSTTQPISIGSKKRSSRTHFTSSFIINSWFYIVKQTNKHAVLSTIPSSHLSSIDVILYPSKVNLTTFAKTWWYCQPTYLREPNQKHLSTWMQTVSPTQSDISNQVHDEFDWRLNHLHQSNNSALLSISDPKKSQFIRMDSAKATGSSGACTVTLSSTDQSNIRVSVMNRDYFVHLSSSLEVDDRDLNAGLGEDWYVVVVRKVASQLMRPNVEVTLVSPSFD